MLGSLLRIAPQLKEVKLPTLIEPWSLICTPPHLTEVVKLPTLIEPEVKFSTRTELDKIEKYKAFLENWASLKKGTVTENICEFGFLM